MNIPPYAQAGIVCVALLSLFWLPWPISLILSFLAGLVFPPVPFAIGILGDILYYPGVGPLWGVIFGLIVSIISYVVRQFVKTSIM